MPGDSRVLHTELVNIPCAESVSHPNSCPTVGLRHALLAGNVETGKGEGTTQLPTCQTATLRFLPLLASRSRMHTLGSVEYMTPH